VGCSSWEFAITELILQFQASGVLTENDVERLLGLLAEDIPREMRYLKAVYGHDYVTIQPMNSIGEP
jgi:hypothetical protein